MEFSFNSNSSNSKHGEYHENTSLYLIVCYCVFSFEMADSDNEVERFEVTEYDLQNEFFPGMKRRKMTKEQTMLGIWAGRDSDEDDYSERKRNDSIPLQFVSGGVVKSKDKDELGYHCLSCTCFYRAMAPRQASPCNCKCKIYKKQR